MPALLCVIGVLAGCAHEQQFPAQVRPARPVSGLAAAAFPEFRPEPGQENPRRRLDHVITLGRDQHLPGERPRTPTATPTSSVVVQNNVFVTPQQPTYGWGVGYGYGYGGYAYPRIPAEPARPSTPATQTPPVAGDWPAPPSYGPPLGAR